MRASGPVQRTEVNLDVLRGVDLFAGLDDSDHRTLAVCLQAHRYGAGEVLFQEGEPGATLLIVAEGRLVATARRTDGAGEPLNEMDAGEVAGEMAFLDPAPRSATVTAVTPAVVYQLTHDTMSVLRERSPASVRAIVTAAIRDVTRRLRHLDTRIESELERIGALQPREDGR
jgi:CRP/FNR family transcriptional regulator, cyclic AMP receptor protein